MQVYKPSIKGEADLESSIAITCDIVIISLGNCYYIILKKINNDLRAAGLCEIHVYAHL